ncbi:MAG: hypothetical protein H6647_21920 [Anaerolineales bacterium]|nr:hypothetical protein [Anaerolineales bacterium]
MTFEEALNDCLERMRRGESLQSCLARFPQHAADLAPLLQVGQMLRSAPPALSADAFSRGRVILRDAALADHSASWGQRLGDTLRGLIVPLGLAAAALVVILVIGAAWSSAPGETLYPLRRLAQTAAIRVSPDANFRAGQHLLLAEQQLAELQAGWTDSQTVVLDDVTRFGGEIDRALAELAVNPESASSVTLQGLVSIAYEGRAWLLSIAGRLPAGQQASVSQITRQLADLEQWAQAGLLDPSTLRGYRSDGEPPALPTLPATSTPTATKAAPTRQPSATTTTVQSEATATELTTATPPSRPTPTKTPTFSPPTPTPESLPPTATATSISSGVSQPTGKPVEPTGTTQPAATATPLPVNATPSRTATQQPASATPSPTATYTPSATYTPVATRTATPSATPRLVTPTPTLTTEPTETEEATHTPEATETPRPTATLEETETLDVLTWF